MKMKNKYIVRENSSGKTRELLEFAKENNLAVICRNKAAMERKAQAYGIYELIIFSYDEVVYLYNEGIDFNNYPFVVDEVESFLSFFFGSECRGFTQTTD